MGLTTARALARTAPMLRHTVAMDQPIPADCHPKIARLIGYWQSLSPGPGLLPGRQHIDSRRIPDLLTHIWMLDVVPHDRRRYRVRLIGGAVVEAGARARKGEFFVDSMAPSEVEQSLTFFGTIEAGQQANWKRGPSALEHMDHIYALERAMMPMAADGSTVDLILCMSMFYWKDGRVY